MYCFFAIIFIETGLVVVPLLLGDSLLFITGTLAAGGAFSLVYVLPLRMLAAILGDVTNFTLGTRFGHRIEARHCRWPKPAHLRMTHEFVDPRGGKTIFIARFIPIIRILAPFAAASGAWAARALPHGT